MSSASPFKTDPVALDTLIESLQWILWPVQFLGFLVAVVAPFLIVGLLVTGIGQGSPSLLAGLLSINVVGIVLGRDYNV